MTSTLDSKSIAEIRSEANRLVRMNSTTSLISTLKFLFSSATVHAIFGGALIALKIFSVQWLIGLSLLCILSSLLAFIFFEFSRLYDHRNILKELLNSEKQYELLLSEMRKEKEEDKEKLYELSTKIEMIRASKNLVDLIEDALVRKNLEESKNTLGENNG